MRRNTNCQNGEHVGLDQAVKMVAAIIRRRRETAATAAAEGTGACNGG